jgi:hypothetical protein
MQVSFSFARLGLLIKKQWADHSKPYLLSIGAMAGLMAVAFFIWVIALGEDADHYKDTTNIFLFVGLFIGGCIFAGMTFSELAQRTTGIYWLAVPATHAEKLVCGILYSQVFYNVVFIAIFYVERAITFSIVGMNHHIQLVDGWSHEETMLTFKVIGLSYIAIQTFYMLGSVYFERFGFVKTSLAGVLILLGVGLIMRYVVFPILPPHINPHSGDSFDFQLNGFIYRLPDWVFTMTKYMVQFVWMPVFWLVTYFRLKEKEL